MGRDRPRLHWLHDLHAPEGPCTVVIAGLGRVDVTAGDIRQARYLRGRAIFTAKPYRTVTSETWYYLDAVEGA